jgi:hypothetical protein
MSNKKTIAILTLGFLSAMIPAFAQGPVFGLKGGLNYSTLAVDEASEEDARIGFHLGGFVRSMPEAPIGIQVELLYSTKGSNPSYSALFDLIDQEVDLNLNYLELPVLASFRIGEVVDLQAGLYGAYLLSAKASTSGDLGSGSEELDKDHFTDFDFGFAGGVGFNVGQVAQIGVRYTHGFNDVADSDEADFFLSDAKNRCAQLFLAIGIGAN